MPFVYMPPTGQLSGQDFENQTLDFLNQLQAQLDQLTNTTSNQNATLQLRMNELQATLALQEQQIDELRQRVAAIGG